MGKKKSKGFFLERKTRRQWQDRAQKDFFFLFICPTILENLGYMTSNVKHVGWAFRLK
jgi:hypothetical protein